MLNKVILMGRLTADPEVRQTPSNISVCRFIVAVDRPYRKDAEKQADFIAVTTWRQTAEFVGKYFAKGRMIIVEGALRNNDYTDKNGVKQYRTEVLADNVTFGESKGGSSAQAAPQTAPAPSTQDIVNKATDASVTIGDLGDFDEIYSDGKLPF